MPATVTQESDKKIFQNALDFSSVKIRDCAIPRTEITALPLNQTTIDDLKEAFINTGYSKIPIFDGDIDNIIGYMHAGDLFKQPTDWHTSIRKIPLVPETMPASRLMRTLMKKKVSMAVVIDEYGGTSGIVTLEDIIEEIFGEIEDEHDNREYTAQQITPTQYQISGRIEISTLNTIFPQLAITESDNYLTLAGYILHHHGKIPKFNETIQIKNLTFKIIKAHKNRIDLVNITVQEP